jgi:hypothetical protein
MLHWEVCGVSVVVCFEGGGREADIICALKGIYFREVWHPVESDAKVVGKVKLPSLMIERISGY